MGQKRVKVNICVGTACFVQGGADLLLYEDFLEPQLLGLCDIEGTSCLGLCKQDNSDWKAPFVEIDGTVYSNVTPKRLEELLREAVDA
jgi:NADH:ubiquinone oxidoreductase subunit E